MDFHKDTWQNIIRHHFIKTFLLFGLACQLGLFQTALGQENGLYVAHSWGTVFGTAGTPDDFLIYDACVADFDSSLIFVVGQSRKADAFKQIPGNSTYFHAKDSLSDAFLACFSTRGQLLWNTYLPAPDSTYLNGSATCVRSFGNRLIVVSNAYPIVISAERTHLNMPLCKGVLCLFEFDQNGELLRSKSFSARYRNRNGLEEDFPYVPRIFDIDKWNEDTLMLSGHGIISPADSYGGHGSGVFCRFLADNEFQQTQLLNEVSGTSDQVDHWLHPNLAFSVTFNHSVDLKPSMTCRITNPFSLWRSSNQKNNPSGAVQPSFSAPGYTFSYGYNLQQPPLFAESWQVFSRLIKNRDYFYATPQNTFRYESRDGDLYKGSSAFSGSVQKTADFREYILVQGIHCKNYYNGYFMPNDSTYSSYSHDSTQSFPFMSGRFDKRNPDFTAVPFLLLYTRSSFNENPIPQPDWAAFLEADWLYRDLFSCIDLAHPQNYYMPAAPILLSSGNRFFVIGNATAIGDKSIRGFFSGDKIQNESSLQGLLMAFQSGCPPKLAHIAAPDLICPGDSALLKLPIEYDDYLFVFDSVFLRDGSISVSADSMQAWAKKTGDYHAILSSRLEGCEDAYTDTIRVQALNPAPTPNRYLPQDSVLCAHLDLDLQLPDEVSDTYRCFWLDKDSVELPYGHDTSRFTVSGMRGTDGFGANTDTRQPRFFQLRLDHKACGVSFFDTLLVYDQVKPNFVLPFHDTIICLNEPVELDSLSPLVYRKFYGFEWSTGEKTSGFSFSDSGTYALTFSVLKDFAFCGYEPARDTVHTQWSDPALTWITLPEDTSFCEKLSVTLDGSVPFPSTRYSWQEGNLDDLVSPLEDSTRFTSPVLFKVDKEATFALFVVDTMGCVNTRQINIREEDCKPQLSIPNVFTPNGDGVNDVLKFKQVEKCFDVDILIVDRKGAHVLHEKVRDPDDFSWNGCYKNGSKKLPDGPYFYLVSCKDAYGKKKVQSGSITILGSSE